MTRAQTVDVLNDSTTLQSRIDTVLATPDLDWSNDSGWQPGDPLYERPDYTRGGQWIRRMFDLYDEEHGHNTLIVPAESHVGWSTEPWYPRCPPCEVSWSDGDTCWNCGAECPRPSYGSWGPMIAFDETHEWSRASLRPFIEAMDDFSRQMARLAAPMEQFRQRHLERLADIEWADPEPITEESRQSWARGNSTSWRLLPSVADVNAPTRSDIQAGEPLAAWEIELLESTRTEEPVIRIPAGVEITPVAPVPLPESISITGRRRRQTEFERYYFNRPVTETRRTR